MESTNLRNRRGIGFVTPNACTECRKKRTKCDGRTPCGRCRTLEGSNCVYEVPTRQSKDQMRMEISQLRTRQRRLEEILAAVAPQHVSSQVLNHLQTREGSVLESISGRGGSSRSTPKSAENNVTTYSEHAHFQAISDALESAQNAGSTSVTAHRQGLPTSSRQGSSQGQQIGRKESLPGGDLSTEELPDDNPQLNSMSWTSDPTQSAHSSHPAVGIWQERPANAEFYRTIQSTRSRGQDVILGDWDESEMSWEHHGPKYSRESWTTVTSDKKIVEHLLALYFCWEYPTFASLSKEHFMEDFRLGIPRYCSPLLVNALLALGCRFSDQSIARADPDDHATTGDHFFAEATKLLETEGSYRVLTTIQALGIMSIREASCGRVDESIYLSTQSIRLAIEMGLHLDAEDNEDDSDDPQDDTDDADQAVRQATFWGAFSLDEIWSFCTGSLPHLSRSSKLIIKPAILQHVEIAKWIPYTDDGGPLEQNCIQPSNIRSVYKTFCELSEIIHRTLYIFHNPGVSVTSKALIEMYSEYIHWFDGIPDTLRLGHNFTPSVLFAHLYYHFAIFLLFRPFVDYAITGSDFSPRDICDQASRAISSVLKSYSGLYTLRRTPSFLPYFVLSSTLFHLAEYRNGVRDDVSKEQIAQNITYLKNLSVCHGFAAQSLDFVRFLGRRWGVEGLGEEMDDDGSGGEDAQEGVFQEEFVAICQLGPVTGDIDVLGKYAQVSCSTSALMRRKRLSAVDEQLEKNGFRRIRR